jgi:complement component 1 Q subcomponent-binding protein
VLPEPQRSAVPDVRHGNCVCEGRGTYLNAQEYVLFGTFESMVRQLRKLHPSPADFVVVELHRPPVKMRRFVASTTKAVVSANTARRTFHSLKAAVPAFRTQQASGARFASNLADVLTKEHSEEQSNANELEQDQELVDVQKQVLKSFKLKEQLGNADVLLTRKHNNETIEVKFNIQDIEHGDDMNMDDEEEQDEESANRMGINFEVKVKKGSDAVLFHLFASDQLTIRNVKYVDAKHTPASENDDDPSYQGPEYDSLAEDVQASFYEYLSERKVDDDLSFFVLAYSRDKEQREYVNWLDKIKEFAQDA